MCGNEENGRFGLKLVSTVAGFASLACVFTTALPQDAQAHVVPPTNVRHLFRQTLIPTGEAGKAHVGLWILNPANGRVRLCLLEEPGADSKEFLKCSKWLGGSDVAGRYRMMDINRRLPSYYRRLMTTSATGLSGVWILNYQTGAAQACVITNRDNPTGSLTCAAAP
ncbi:MAG: hypothetical protein RLT05_19985 [Bauldia litoralis]